MIRNLKKILFLFILMVIASLSTVIIYSNFFQKEKIIVARTATPYELVSLPAEDGEKTLDFTAVATHAVHAVVHVTNKASIEKSNGGSLFEFFYGDSEKEISPIVSFGSGVIISPDGYIVTNNHVIANSNELTVKLNDNREFPAELIGLDKQTDLALLKINVEEIPYIPFGNSDNLKVGAWVLAVGNPFNLTSTVTAGIVSAKGRNLGILNDRYRIESFIQTDAAVNRGNSGGALINTKGELVGVNTAIISPSGAYSGNSFAVPVNIVKKVVKDLQEFGNVQRAILGVSIKDVDANIAKENNLDYIKGVYVAGLTDNGAAQEAGIQKGDIIIKVNEAEVNSTSELQEQISMYRPKDIVKILIIRDKKEKPFEVTLRNIYGNTEIIENTNKVSFMGAVLETIKDFDKKNVGIQNGVKITELEEGKFKSAGLKQGFIILQINKKPVYESSDVKRIIENSKDDGVYIEGIYPNGKKAYYAFGK